MLFKIIITFIFVTEADDPIQSQADSQIERECAPRLQQGVDHYTNCITQRGLEAERARLAETRQTHQIATPPTQPVQQNCKPQEALASCQRASQNALEIYVIHNPRKF